MKLKTQIKIYQKLVSELGEKYEGAEDFINSRIKDLCSEHEILEEEVHFVCIYIQNSFVLKCRACKKLKRQVFLLRCIEADCCMQDKTDRNLADKNSAHQI